MMLREGTTWNFSYYPVLFENESKLLKVEKGLKQNNIHARRYFYPALNTINYSKGKAMPITESIASRILCLPLHAHLTIEEVKSITNIIVE